MQFDGGSTGPLSVGVHYYVCTPHAGGGMKGTITVTSTVGIPSVADLSFKLFPNPVVDNLSIELPEEGNTIKVYDLTGNVLAEYNDVAAGIMNVGVLENKPAGVYLVSVTNRKTVITRRIAKK